MNGPVDPPPVLIPHAETAPLMGDVRGTGALAALELVADRETKRPFEAALGVTKRLHALARARGLMIYPGAGGDGAGDQILITPPLIVSREDVDLIVDLLALALTDLSTLNSPMSEDAPSNG